MLPISESRLYFGSIPNVRYVGKGSGKLARYLRSAKPVIVDCNANLDFIADYGAGVVISQPSDIPAAIRRIQANMALTPPTLGTASKKSSRSSPIGSRFARHSVS